MDTLTVAGRSERMRRIRSKNTKPELALRRLIYGLGYRYRLHGGDLPGKPDIVFPSRRKVIFMHGCFWHRHSDETCRLARLPKSRHEFWIPKLEGNRQRNIADQARLQEMGWDVMIVWECQLLDMNVLRERVQGFIEP